jgi:glycosyltransferase involved in cell wall biosynthesis
MSLENLEGCKKQSAPTPSSTSVVVTAFNSEYDLLTETLHSAILQSAPPEDIIVVDDGSQPEKALDIQAAVSQIPCAKLVRQNNAGLSAARNTGASITKNPYIAFLDHDDTWEPDFLRILERTLAADTRLGAVFCRVRHMRPDGSKTQRVSKPKMDKLKAKDFLLTDPAACGSSFLVRRLAFDQIGGFDPELLRAETPDFFIRLLAVGWRVRGVDAILVNYRNSPISLTTGNALVCYRRRILAKAFAHSGLLLKMQFRVLLELNQFRIQLRRWLMHRF